MNLHPKFPVDQAVDSLIALIEASPKLRAALERAVLGGNYPPRPYFERRRNGALARVRRLTAVFRGSK